MDESTSPLPSKPGTSGVPTAQTGPTDPKFQGSVTAETAPAERGASFFPGRRLGSIVLVRPIGRGGMGEVWLGRDELLARDVAVKFVTHTTSTEAGWKLFLDGARAAAAVRHPRLVTLYSADIVEGVPYLVMEYVEAPSLAEVLKAHGPLSAPAVLAAIEQAAEGIEALHAADIIHRDIKPANLLLDPETGVRVTDFGLAHERPVKGENGGGRRVAGTPGYMAPEMFEGMASVKTDVYALAATLFELATGNIPFERGADSNDWVAGAISKRLRARSMNEGIADVIARALHSNAILRTNTSSSFVEGLRHVAGSTWGTQRERDDLVRWALVARSVPASSSSQVGPMSSTESLHQFAETKRSDRSTTNPNRDPLPSSLRPILVEVPDTCVSIDLLCLRCGHGLRGVATNGMCPECRLAVSKSLDQARLCFASRANKRTRCLSLKLAACAMMCPILLPYVYRNVPIVQNVELSLASASSMITTVCVSLLVVIATVLWTRRRDGYEATMTGRLARATAIVLTIVTISVASDVPKLSLVMLRYEWLDGTAAWWYSAREWIGKICMLLLGTAGALSIRRAVMTIPNPEVARFASTTIAIGWLSLLVKIGAHLWITYSRRTAGMNARTPFLSTVDEIIPKVATVWLVAAYAAFLVLIVIAVRVMKAVPWLVYVERSTRTASGAAAPTSPP